MKVLSKQVCEEEFYIDKDEQQFTFLSQGEFICAHQSISGFSTARARQEKLASFLQLKACGIRQKLVAKKKAFSGDCFRHKFSAVLLSHTTTKSGFSQFSPSPFCRFHPFLFLPATEARRSAIKVYFRRTRERINCNITMSLTRA
jgi:hypothetical protein